MKIRLFILMLFIFKVGYSQSEKLEDYEIANINNVIELFKKQNIDSISTIIRFPLKREYPIPSIKNELEFKTRFHEVFDKTLIGKIAYSKARQWSEVGSRGIMLGNGIVWIDSYEGKIIDVNYQSNFEKRLKSNLIDKEKENLHLSLKSFESSKYKIRTVNYLIRIDELSNHKYRYASWKISEKESSKPDLILKNGELEYKGRGKNHVITFVNGNFTYKVYRNTIGAEDTADINLEVKKDGEVILTEEGTLITE